MKRMSKEVVFILALLFLTTACGANSGDDADTFTGAEIQLALEESVESAEGEALVGGVIEISTSFTIGEAVEQAGEELRAWLESQIACSTVTREGATLILDFGDLEDECVYNGHTYAGIDAITIARNESAEVLVSHLFTDLSNGDVTVSGSADVTWSAADISRRVVHNLTWTRAVDGETLTASGDRLQRLLSELGEQEWELQVDGERDWSNSHGDWHLDISSVQMRGLDPVPYSGSYSLINPDGKELTITFEQVDGDTIGVTISGGQRSWQFNVTSTGSSSES